MGLRFLFLEIMIKRSGYWFCFCAMLSFAANAQQLPQSSLFSLNPYLINPAFSGMYDYSDVRIGHRRQWIGFDDAPITTSLTANFPINAGDKVPKRINSPRYSPTYAKPQVPPEGTVRWGTGLQLIADQAGITDRNLALVTGGVHWSLANEWQLSGGVGAGVLQLATRFDKIHTANPDPILPDGKVTSWRPFFTVGGVLQNRDFLVGLSVLSPNTIRMSQSNNPAAAGNRIVPHFYFTTLYRLALGEEWSLLPQVWLKAVGKAPVSADGLVRLQYNNRFWGGVQYRSGESLGFQLGMGLTTLLSVAYAYDYPLSGIAPSSAGSHEIVLGFRFNNRSRIYCPPLGW